MQFTSNQAIKINSTKTSYQSTLVNSQFCLLSESQKLQQVNQAEPDLKSTPPNPLLYSCFRNLAYIGQMGSAIIALALAIELASSLTVVTVILGILWISCEHLGSVDP
ncbi:MAG: hypothetical protein WBA13_17970 [Microcoleaceae cyanobacterium]